MIDFKKEYQAYPSRELAKIANAAAGEYRPDAIEAARAELANRGETWEKKKRESGKKPDSSGPERDWSSRRDHLMMQYAVCWALLVFGAVRIVVSVVALFRQGDFSSWNKGLWFPGILVLVAVLALCGLHKRLFGRPGRAKNTGPLLNLVDCLESLRPPPIEGETDPQRNRSRGK